MWFEFRQLLVKDYLFAQQKRKFSTLKLLETAVVPDILINGGVR